MELDSTERAIRMIVPAGEMTSDLSAVTDQLVREGFEVSIVEDHSIDEPRLATDVGLFVGKRSISGFARQYRDFFRVAHANAEALSR